LSVPVVVDSLRGSLADARDHGVRSGAIDLFRIPLDAVAARHAALLDDAERSRAARRARAAGDAATVNACASRAALRLLLARWLAVDARALAFEEGERGRPRLARPDVPDLDFNLSHSRSLALVAIARGVRVGIDLERSDAPRDVEKLASRVLSDAERREFLACGEREAAQYFYRAWCAKEAFGKAVGLGLALLPRRYATGFDASGRGRVEGLPDELGFAREAKLFELALPDGFAGVLCAIGEVAYVRSFDARELVA